MSCEINPLEAINHFHIKVKQYHEGNFSSDYGKVLLDEDGNEVIAATKDEIRKLMIEDVDFYIASYSNLGTPSIKQICDTSCVVEWHDQDEKIIQGCVWELMSH